MNKLDFALEAVGQGFSVVPASPSSKIPHIRLKAYQEEPMDKAALREYWASNPDYNIGIVTGRVSGITVVDVDGPTGEESLAKAGIHLPDTYVVRAPLAPSPQGCLAPLESPVCLLAAAATTGYLSYRRG